MLRCDDIFVDTKVEDCRRIWSLIGKYGFRQVLGVVARGSGAPILRHKPARQGNKWIIKHSGDTWFGTNAELKKQVQTQLDRGDLLGLHGLYHISYRKEPYATQLEHLRLGKEYLESQFNTEVKYFVPPFNGCNDDTKRVASKLGMEITYPPPSEMDVFILNKDNTRNKIRKLARHDADGKNYPFYHPFLLGGDWKKQKIYIERHDKYMDIPPPTWNLNWALRRFEVYLKEMRRHIDNEIM